MQRRFGVILFFCLCACFSACSTPELYPFAEPNDLLREQIERRVNELQYLHDAELIDTLDWLTRCGEQAYPFLIEALKHENPTTRSGAANVLGRGRDRRVIDYLKSYVEDPDPRMRYEVARSLLRLGDWSNIPILLQGMRDSSLWVRALCNDALRGSTRLDFGFVPSAAEEEREEKVKQWEEWWAVHSKDAFYAKQK